ncbi:exocyst complex component 1 [Anopheles merus]|uniref:Exocyst complex component Sec3 PIP2-binding N-terminal domain-containing protein n=1 Tax=Anopheles merus TaxID=30066 RepID=A0A2C9H5Q5_ANOME|nr:exocyst complex component 1 [Anopheles merus]
MAAGIKYIFQKELFDALDERILSVCNVSKLHKRKKTSYLCIVSTIKPSVIVSVCQIKQYDKAVYKKKRSWSLEEIKCVDGRNEATDTHDFDVLLDKPYRWFAANLHERQNFITVLWKQIHKHCTVGERAVFKNIPKQWLSEKSPEKQIDEKYPNRGGAVSADDEDDIEGFENEDFHALTDKEEAHLNKLVAECDYAISNAELFMDDLSHNLLQLDGANIQSVLESEKQVQMLMERIEEAIQEAEKVEKRLDDYDEILCHVRDTMEKMGEKNQMIEIANTNNVRLLLELEKVVTQLDLPHVHQLALTDTDLTPKGLPAAIAAGKALQMAMNSDIDPALLRLTAVQDQRKRFEKWKAKFSQTISRHLNNLFIHLGNLGDSQTPFTNELSLPKHHNVHKELCTFMELMHWMKTMDRKAYDALIKVYTASLSKVYDRDIQIFFENAKQALTLKQFSSREDINNSSISNKIKLGPQSNKQPAQPYGILGTSKEMWSPGAEAIERQRFDSILEKVLAELEPVALSEQHFCIAFFQLDVISPTAKNTQTTLDAASNETVNQKDERDTALHIPQRRLDRQINEDVRRMMGELFANLETEINNFILSFEKLDNYYSLYVLVRLTQHVMSAQDAQSFLSMTFASALIHVKRSFDKFMQSQLQSIDESKLPKRSKCGLLPYVENFEEFAATAENIFKKTERRNDLDKWYLKLVEAIFERISVHAAEHSKTPHQVVKMENYHRMHSTLSQLKIPVLESLRKEAKTRYNDAQKAYVTKYFGRPLERLNQFFEGIQVRVQQGVKDTEISYQMAYSKQELRKVISLYPAREVKKGLEQLYKKVEKHLCEEENLLQVVWRAMQQEFINQYNSLEQWIQRCYAGSMITLEFTINDLLDFFSEIAQSH